MGIFSSLVPIIIATKNKNNTPTTKPPNFDKYQAKIKKTRENIQSKKETFHKNNNLKEK